MYLRVSIAQTPVRTPVYRVGVNPSVSCSRMMCLDLETSVRRTQFQGEDGV